MDIKDVQKLISEKKDNVLIPMVQSMSENFAKSFETGVEVGIEIGKAISPDYSKVWHKPSEEPEDGAEVLFVWKAITHSYHAVGSYNKKEKRVTSLEVTWLLSKIERWADMRDIDAL